jgi:hypothetical protein
VVPNRLRAGPAAPLLEADEHIDPALAAPPPPFWCSMHGWVICPLHEYGPAASPTEEASRPSPTTSTVGLGPATSRQPSSSRLEARPARQHPRRTASRRGYRPQLPRSSKSGPARRPWSCRRRCRASRRASRAGQRGRRARLHLGADRSLLLRLRLRREQLLPRHDGRCCRSDAAAIPDPRDSSAFTTRRSSPSPGGSWPPSVQPGVRLSVKQPWVSLGDMEPGRARRAPERPSGRRCARRPPPR